MRTTISPYGFGTSFTKDGQEYFVSTAENPPNSNQFETIIKPLGTALTPIIRTLLQNPRRATANHIAIVRMALSTDISEWSASHAIDFNHYTLCLELDKDDLDDADYCLMLLKMAGLNYSTEESRGSKACFIATACFESSDDKNVLRLRRYRDLVLKKTSLGKKLIYFYYKVSPSIASYISDKPKYKKIISNLLKKLLKIIYKKYGI